MKLLKPLILVALVGGLAVMVRLYEAHRVTTDFDEVTESREDAIDLLIAPQPPDAQRAAELEKSLFGGLGAVSAQAQRLAAVLRGAGVPARVLGDREANHSSLNHRLGEPSDANTRELLAFVAAQLK